MSTTTSKLWFVECHGPRLRGSYYLVIANSEQDAIRVSKMGLEDHTLHWCGTEVDTELLKQEPWHISNEDTLGVFLPPWRK